MTFENLFDLVAPIAIYHRADLLFKPQATKAWRKIKKVPAQEWTSADCTPPDLARRLDDLECWAKDAYDKLFWAVVEEHCPAWTWEWDRWGAKAVKDGDDRLVFSGDDRWCFSWYETAELLVKRLNEHHGADKLVNP